MSSSVVLRVSVWPVSPVHAAARLVSVFCLCGDVVIAQSALIRSANINEMSVHRHAGTVNSRAFTVICFFASPLASKSKQGWQNGRPSHDLYDCLVTVSKNDQSG